MSPEVPAIILLIAIPTYFASRWVLKKQNIGDKQSRKLIAIVPAVLLSPVIYVGIIMIWLFAISYYPKQEFDKAKWEKNTEERYRMSQDIINSKMLIGKSEEEVILILGEDYSRFNENEIIYELGHVPGLLNIDPDYLSIHFENGKVVRVEQYEG